MKKINEKKGSHVGIVISFIMFATFIFFFYIIIQPALTSENKKNLADSLNGQMTYLFSSNLTEASVFIDKQNPQNCVEFQGFFSKTGIGDKFIVRANSGIVVSQKNSDNLRVSRNGNVLFRVYGSEEFNIGSGTLTGCQVLNENSGYTLGLVKKTSEVFETKITNFIQNYSINYTNLKKQLKIPDENEFGFDFVYSNGTVTSAQNFQVQPPTSSTNIYVDEIPIQYISRDAAREADILRIKIW